jgi:hypothetical protein
MIGLYGNRKKNASQSTGFNFEPITCYNFQKNLQYFILTLSNDYSGCKFLKEVVTWHIMRNLASKGWDISLPTFAEHTPSMRTGANDMQILAIRR